MANNDSFKGLEVYIHTSNPVFTGSNVQEAARSLREIADRIEDGETFGYIYDSSNAYAGTFRFQD